MIQNQDQDALGASPSTYTGPTTLCSIALLPAKSKRGRPRKFASAADKQKQYRQRKAADQAVHEGAQKWLRIINEHPDNRGRSRHDITGGFNGKRLSQIWDAWKRKDVLGGIQVKPKGHGADSFEIGGPMNVENVGMFMNKIRFPQEWTLCQQEREWITAELVKENFESEECGVAPEFGPNSGLTYKPGTLQCRVCDFRVDWWHQAITHFLDRHGAIVKKRFGEKTPRPVRAPKLVKVCPKSYHLYIESRLKANRSTSLCKRCGRLLRIT